MPGFSDFAGFAGVVEITRLNASEFLYYLDELHGNELVAFSFVSSNKVGSIPMIENRIELQQNRTKSSICC